jgi:hypothetical protein
MEEGHQKSEGLSYKAVFKHEVVQCAEERETASQLQKYKQ